MRESEAPRHSNLTGKRFVRGLTPLAVRTRRTSEKGANNEAMKLMNPRIKRMHGSVVPAGRTGYRAGFPGTLCLANIRRRFATFRVKEGKVGKGGKKVRKWTNFSRFETALTRLFPQVSTQVVDFPHLGVVRVFRKEGFHRGDAEAQSQEEERDRM